MSGGAREGPNDEASGGGLVVSGKVSGTLSVWCVCAMYVRWCVCTYVCGSLGAKFTARHLRIHGGVVGGCVAVRGVERK